MMKLLKVVVEFLIYGFGMIPYVVRCAWHQATCKNMLRNVRYGPRDRNFLDVYFPDQSQRVGRFGNGVLVVVHGGAWYWGTKMYFSRVQKASFPDCTVVVINYTLHPHGACDVMVEDIGLAIKWTVDNICKPAAADASSIPNATTPPLAIVGHSAGAHLVALALVRSATAAAAAAAPMSAGTLAAVGAFVGISGVYHISDHYEHEARRGVADVSPMCGSLRNPLTPAGRAPPVMGPRRDGWDAFSPAALAAAAPRPADAARRLPPRVALLHGEADHTVPVRSSVRFHEALQAAGHPACSLTVIEEGTHSEVFTNLNDRGRPYQERVAAAIRRAAGIPRAAAAAAGAAAAAKAELKSPAGARAR